MPPIVSVSKESPENDEFDGAQVEVDVVIGDVVIGGGRCPVLVAGNAVPRRPIPGGSLYLGALH